MGYCQLPLVLCKKHKMTLLVSCLPITQNPPVYDTLPLTPHHRIMVRLDSPDLEVLSRWCWQGCMPQILKALRGKEASWGFEWVMIVAVPCDVKVTTSASGTEVKISLSEKQSDWSLHKRSVTSM